MLDMYPYKNQLKVERISYLADAWGKALSAIQIHLSNGESSPIFGRRIKSGDELEHFELKEINIKEFGARSKKPLGVA